MKQGHIYIEGDIGFTGDFLSMEPVVTYNDVKRQLEENKDMNSLVVHINSRGGIVDEGYAIRDLLVLSGKKIITVGERQVASIATVIFAAGTERHLFPNTKPRIHNPWGTTTGDADTHEKRAAELRDIEEKLANDYATWFGGDADTFRELMKQDRDMTPAEALELKIATKILEPARAFALITNKPEEMKDLQETNSKLDALIEMGKKFLNIKTENTKNLNVTADSGQSLQIEGEEIVENASVKIDGKPAEDGAYSFEDEQGQKKTLNVQAGKIASIEVQLPDETVEAKLEKAQAEIVALKETLAAREKAEGEILAKMDTLSQAMAGISSNFNIINTTDFKKEETEEPKLTPQQKAAARIKAQNNNQ